MSSENHVGIMMAENLRFLGEGSSAQGKSGAKARPRGVVDAHTPVDILFFIAGDLDIRPESLICAIDCFRDPCQRHGRRTETAEFPGIRIRLRLPESVQQPHQSAALPQIIMQVQQ